VRSGTETLELLRAKSCTTCEGKFPPVIGQKRFDYEAHGSGNVQCIPRSDSECRFMFFAGIEPAIMRASFLAILDLSLNSPKHGFQNRNTFLIYQREFTAFIWRMPVDDSGFGVLL